ncbi:MAG: PadR family transcriptional regulator [Anaerolineales bacterium]|nr:PadR family transcriptional regulator [Anaerolineales bacterium]
MNFRHFVLGLLSRQPMSGYDIKRLLKNLNWLIGNPSFGSLYPTLRKLLNEGLVTVQTQSNETRPNRKIYSITEQGQRVLEEWNNRPAKTDASLKTFLMRLILADIHSIDSLVAYMEKRRAQVTRQQAALEKFLNDGTEQDTKQYLAHGYGLVMANAELNWLDDTLNRLPGTSERA